MFGQESTRFRGGKQPNRIWMIVLSGCEVSRWYVSMVLVRCTMRVFCLPLGELLFDGA